MKNRRTPAPLVSPLAAALLLFLAPTAAADTLYKCQEDDGRVIYTNQKGNKKCDVIVQDKPVSTFTPTQMEEKPAARARSKGFPRVDDQQQRTRDMMRRGILEREMTAELNSLEAAKLELKRAEEDFPGEERVSGGGINASKRNQRLQPFKEKVELHERNLESIRKEISNLENG